MKKREHRFVKSRELRVLRTETGDPVVEGYAAVFNSRSEDLGGFREQIIPGAFQDCLAAQPDVRALFNHDESLILGRTKSGTLTLGEDETGLQWRCTLPPTQVARDLAVSIERGDIDQCSFGFYCLDDDWSLQDGTPLRSVRKAELFDVSAVTFPAYADTSVATRSLWRDGRPESIEAALRQIQTPRCGGVHCQDPLCYCAENQRLRARLRVLAA